MKPIGPGGVKYTTRQPGLPAFPLLIGSGGATIAPTVREETMAKDKKKSGGVAAAYAEWKKRLGAGEANSEEVRQAAQELHRFGLDADQFIIHKLGTAESDELRLVINLARHFDSPEIGDGLREVIAGRTVPLALKLECFETMTELGHSLERELLEKLHEAEQLYHQLGSYLSQEGEEGVTRSISLAEDFVALPESLRLSFLQQACGEWGARTLPFATQLAGMSDDLDELLVDLVEENESVEAVALLTRLAENGGKETVKKARKALYKLRQKGVVSAAEAGEDHAGEETVQAEGEQAFVSNIDSFGARMLLLAIPTLHDVLVCQGTVSEEYGLLRFSSGEMQRKQYRGFIKEVREQVESDTHSSIVQIEPNHCRWLFEQAYLRCQQKGSLVPERYKGLRYRLKPPEGFDPSAELRRRIEPSEDEISRAEAHMEDIFSIPEVGIWMIERESLLPYVRRYIEMAESKLVLNEQQRQARLEDALTDFSAEYFGGEGGRLPLMVRRLEETALLLSLRGKPEQARLIAALAASVAGSSFLQPHSFLRNFMLRSVAGTIHALRDEEQRRSGRIIRPGGE